MQISIILCENIQNEKYINIKEYFVTIFHFSEKNLGKLSPHLNSTFSLILIL
jgi:hypothetical protein